jgi:hypothetical protein
VGICLFVSSFLFLVFREWGGMRDKRWGGRRTGFDGLFDFLDRGLEIRME